MERAPIFDEARRKQPQEVVPAPGSMIGEGNDVDTECPADPNHQEEEGDEEPSASGRPDIGNR